MDDRRYFPPWVLQVAGLLLLVVFGVVWIVTKRESALFVGAAVSLILLGGYGSAREELRRVKPPPPPGTEVEVPEEAS